MTPATISPVPVITFKVTVSRAWRKTALRKTENNGAVLMSGTTTESLLY
jgi:hypothetical protein